MGVMGKALRETGDRIRKVRGVAEADLLIALPYDVSKLVGGHRLDWNLGDVSRNRQVLRNEFTDRVSDTDDDDRCVHAGIGKQLDRVRHEATGIRPDRHTVE